MSPPWGWVWGTFNAQVWGSDLQLLDLDSSVFIHSVTPPPVEEREREKASFTDSSSLLSRLCVCFELDAVLLP